MGKALERARTDTEGWTVYLLTAYYFLANNVSVVAILLGIGMWLFGGTILIGQPVDVIEHHVFAGMFGVWGASIALLGALAYAILLVNKLYIRLQSGTESEPDSDGELQLESL